MSNLIHKELSYIVRGVLIDVHNKLGPRLPEKFYQQAVTHGLRERGITSESEKQFDVLYREKLAGLFYVDHWLEGGKILLEFKVAPYIMPIHQAQTISYLKLTNADLAIIANFGTHSLQDKRLPNFIRDKKVDFQWQPKTRTENTLYPALLDSIFEALYRVHFVLGPGFIHRVYRDAVMIELWSQGMGYEYIRKIQVYYNNHCVGLQKAQVIRVENKILLGVFAVESMDKVMGMVMKARMRHLGMRVGVLANFYGERLVVETVV
ncbi:GxxExxY protein [Candidatus Marithioploca araucensis]|uniref:GxxExxY protein n=1 Tax=Candidatus Marithioploca araucensis TaxID=70273 RepID=A0ABT7VS84_9GAMM|nr:GxxExxY protein [Candidatus Marithioploca araucensis]